MKEYINKIIRILIYFFTPEDSATLTRNGIFSYKIERGTIGLGSIKALFWVMNAMILLYLASLL